MGQGSGQGSDQGFRVRGQGSGQGSAAGVRVGTGDLATGIRGQGRKHRKRDGRRCNSGHLFRAMTDSCVQYGKSGAWPDWLEPESSSVIEVESGVSRR